MLAQFPKTQKNNLTGFKVKPKMLIFMSIFVSFFFLGTFSFAQNSGGFNTNYKNKNVRHFREFLMKNKKTRTGSLEKQQEREEKQKERQAKRVKLQEKIQQRITSKYQTNINRLGYFSEKITKISDLSVKIGYDNSVLINNIKDIEKIKSDMENFVDQINQTDIDINNMRQQQKSIRDNIKKVLTETKDEFKNLRMFLKNKRRGNK